MPKTVRLSPILASLPMLGGASALMAEQVVIPPEARLSLPIAPLPFAGRIGPTPETSVPDWPRRVQAPVNAPNVLLIMTDDVGFAASSAFGGPIPTPNLDMLAQRGLRYNNFHTTAICSATRAALLTGRNAHRVGEGLLSDLPSGYPGYSSAMPLSAASVAQVLRLNGYNTAMFGKHHNLPNWEASDAGPFDHWPTGMGFDHFFGFVGGDTDQYAPHLYRDNSRVSDAEANGDLLDKRLADEAIGWIHNQKAAAPDKPFFAYIAPGSLHAPHQAPDAWIARFKGQFDGGWDKLRQDSFRRQRAMGIVPPDAVLTPRPAEIPAWDSLDADARFVEARSMEVAAATLAYQDAQIGRVIDELKRMGQFDNTLVIFIEGDNGASGEAGPRGTANEIGHIANGVTDDTESLMRVVDKLGGPETYSNYPVGWAWAINCPFRWVKQIASHLGGIRNGLVMTWPEGIRAQGELRSQFGHVNDIVPTILEAAGLPAPHSVRGVAQMPMDGTSLAYSFNDPRAPEQHKSQYFEIAGNIGFYQDGWFLSNTPTRLPWEKRANGETPRWELYNLRQDYSQAHDLAAKNPAKLAEMQALWEKAAADNSVFPIDTRFADVRQRAGMAPLAAQLARTKFTYWGADTSVSLMAAPSLAGRSFTLTADIVVPPNGGSGVLTAYGSRLGGWSFYLDKDGVPVALEAFSHKPEDKFAIRAPRPLAAGPAQVRFEFISDTGLFAGGMMHIAVNGQRVAEGRIPRTIQIPAGLGETFDIGRDTGVPVTDYGRPHGRFDGIVRRVDVELGPRGPAPAPAPKPGG